MRSWVSRSESMRPPGELSRDVELREQGRERRDVVVALDHGGPRAEHGNGPLVERPHLRAHRTVMRVHETVALARMTGEVDLPHGRRRNGGDVRDRVEAVVH